MTLRNPLVFIPGGNPNIQELPAGDTLGGAAAGTNGTNGMNGGAVTIAYTFSTTTTDSDPGSGNLRLDNATQNTATHFYVDLNDANGVDYTSVLDTLDASTNATKGQLRLVKVGDATKFLTFTFSARTTATGYRKFTVTNTGSSSSSPFSNGDSILLCFTQAGDAGSTTVVFKKFSTVTTSSSQATIVFSTIPATSQDIMLVVQGRDTTSGTSDSSMSIFFNADTTAANYDGGLQVAGSGSAASSGGLSSSSKGIFCGFLPNDGATAGATGMYKVLIPNYAGTTWFKNFICETYDRIGTSPTKSVAVQAATWKSTAAIATITLSAATAFKDGTIATMYLLG